MPVAGDTYDFSQDNIRKSPDEAGVYALFDGGQVIYYGSSALSIQDRLQTHFDGDDGPCTKGATGYKREICNNGLTRERELLEAHKRQNNRLPRCNDVIP